MDFTAYLINENSNCKNALKEGDGLNDKLWKKIQIGSFSLAMLLFVYNIIALPLEPLPDGGWQATFPSVTYQVIMVVIAGILLLTWAFATFVRKVGEVSMVAFQRTIIFLVGFGIFFWILQQMH
ncbi:hypothetical protein SAMN05216238_1216 [Lentibacillus persicus]|uniref:Uncharacterized protein n=1 Tax=Lentibacillus persicus TaxID=640948 RepID=A0A1I2B4Y3_9BACI|nr:hypothetical protein [Lentibacillus persicus]SFE50353.1 hypothetical protein SAMN05216238_1216 [Lentibacillus persicus]